MDVAVTCPFAKCNLNRDSPAEYCASSVKHRKYDPEFVNTNYDFSALIFESSGAVNREGKEFLAQLFRFAARYSGTHLSVFAGRAWARLSCTLQSAVAQSIINREPEIDQANNDLFLDDSEESVASFSVCALPLEGPIIDNSTSPFVPRAEAPVFTPSQPDQPDIPEPFIFRASAPSFAPTSLPVVCPNPRPLIKKPLLLLTCEPNLWKNNIPHDCVSSDEKIGIEPL